MVGGAHHPRSPSITYNSLHSRTPLARTLFLLGGGRPQAVQALYDRAVVVS
jgi:hypothetical protein